MKNILFSTLLATGLTLVLVSSVKADFELIKRKITLAPTKAALQFEKVIRRTELKRERAYQEIDRRIEALNRLIERINKVKRISEEQKASLVAQVQAEITSLTNLRAKIAADTDLTTLTADKKSIVDSYRIFVVFMPKITIIAHADAIIETAELMKEKNPSADALAKITEALNQANSAISKVINLDPSGYPGNKSELQSARSMLQVARQDLKSAWDIIKIK